jgi:hypothetical protein
MTLDDACIILLLIIGLLLTLSTYYSYINIKS